MAELYDQRSNTEAWDRIVVLALKLSE